MSDIAVLGSGAFGTALAISQAANGRNVVLWGRDTDHIANLRAKRTNTRDLPDCPFPETLMVTSDLGQITAPIILLCIPMQSLGGFLALHRSNFEERTLVACCKGIDLSTGDGPTATIGHHCPQAKAAILTGPSFAIDIAKGLPTALTLAVQGDAANLQSTLSTRNIRVYSTTDRVGAELGGAMKNVMALACGAAIGAGLGESARAALVTRGFAEMTRFAATRGADPKTLAGLSGLGDLVLTCTSTKSRNFTTGIALGKGQLPNTGRTVEGVATSQALAEIAKTEGLDLPISSAVADLVTGAKTVNTVLKALLSRPLKEE